MHRPGSHPDKMEPEDFLCDYCGRPWTIAQPFVEGHQGSCICGQCLTAALRALEGRAAEEDGSDPCTMCLEVRKEPGWCVAAPVPSPANRTMSRICRRCALQAMRTLQRDKESGWKSPASNT